MAGIRGSVNNYNLRFPTYSTDIYYPRGSVVIYNPDNFPYIASADAAVGVTPGNDPWRRIDPGTFIGGVNIPTWSATDDYNRSSTVRLGNNLWFALQDGTRGVSPTEGTVWTRIVLGDSVAAIIDEEIAKLDPFDSEWILDQIHNIQFDSEWIVDEAERRITNDLRITYTDSDKRISLSNINPPMNAVGFSEAFLPFLDSEEIGREIQRSLDLTATNGVLRLEYNNVAYGHQVNFLADLDDQRTDSDASDFTLEWDAERRIIILADRGSVPATQYTLVDTDYTFRSAGALDNHSVSSAVFTLTMRNGWHLNHTRGFENYTTSAGTITNANVDNVAGTITVTGIPAGTSSVTVTSQISALKDGDSDAAEVTATKSAASNQNYYYAFVTTDAPAPDSDAYTRVPTLPPTTLTFGPGHVGNTSVDGMDIYIATSTNYDWYFKGFLVDNEPVGEPIHFGGTTYQRYRVAEDVYAPSGATFTITRS